MGSKPILRRSPSRTDLSLMGLDGFWTLNVVKVAQITQQSDIFRSIRYFAVWIQPSIRESCIEVVSSLNLFHVFTGELYAESLDIGFEMSHNTATDEWVYIGGLFLPSRYGRSVA